MKKKMPCIAAGALTISALLAGTASGVTYFSEDFQNQTGVPFGPPPIGSLIKTSDSTGDPFPVSLSTYPDPALPASAGGKAMAVSREAGTNPVVAMYSNAGAMVSGNTLEFSWNCYQEGLGYIAPQQVGIGMANGGDGRLLFFGVNDYGGTGNLARYFYQTRAGQVMLNTKPTGQLPGELPGWDQIRTVFRLAVSPEFPEYMTGTFDLYLTRDVLNVNTPEVLPVEEKLIDNLPLGYGIMPTAQDSGTVFDDMTAALFRVARGPEYTVNDPTRDRAFFDNILITGTGVAPVGADANGDGIVDTLDFNILAGNFGFAGQTFSQGDFSGDGLVDSVDFGIYLNHYGERTSPAAALGSVVPEPASLSLLAGSLVMLRRRRVA